MKHFAAYGAAIAGRDYNATDMSEPVEGVGALLPFAGKGKTVALIGPLADNQRELLGAWTVTGDPKNVITLKTALSRTPR